MRPLEIGGLSRTTLVIGAKQLVVQEALEMMWSSAVRVSSLTPITTVLVALLVQK